MEGGCRCGRVRYRLGEPPFDPGWCHCRICQKTSGAPAMAFATVRRRDWQVTAGLDHLAERRTSAFGTRSHCQACGTPLTLAVDFQPDTLDVALATLDRPELVTPAFRIFWRERIAWDRPGDDLPRFDAFRPGTVGLSGTEPPEG